MTDLGRRRMKLTIDAAVARQNITKTEIQLSSSVIGREKLMKLLPFILKKSNCCERFAGWRFLTTALSVSINKLFCVGD